MVTGRSLLTLGRLPRQSHLYYWNAVLFPLDSAFVLSFSFIQDEKKKQKTTLYILWDNKYNFTPPKSAKFTKGKLNQCSFSVGFCCRSLSRLYKMSYVFVIKESPASLSFKLRLVGDLNKKLLSSQNIIVIHSSTWQHLGSRNKFMTS